MFCIDIMPVYTIKAVDTSTSSALCFVLILCLYIPYKAVDAYFY